MRLIQKIFIKKTVRRAIAPFTQNLLGGTLNAPAEFSTFYGFASVIELSCIFLRRNYGPNFSQEQQQRCASNVGGFVFRFLRFLGRGVCSVSLTLYDGRERAAGTTGAVQSSASRGGTRARLPVLSHHGRKIGVRGSAANGDLHDVSFTGVERRAGPRAGSREHGKRAADSLAARESTA